MSRERGRVVSFDEKCRNNNAVAHPPDINGLFNAEWTKPDGKISMTVTPWLAQSQSDGEPPAVTGRRPSRFSRRRRTTVAEVPPHKFARVSRVLGPTSSTTLGIKRGDKVSVYIHVVFLKIGEIDTVKEKYAADVFIQARWREPLFDELQFNIKQQDIVWTNYWNPQLYVDNVAGELKETIWRNVMWRNRKEAFVFERRRVAGSFLESFDLFQFPFDTQEITLSIMSERLEKELVLVEEDGGELSTINVQSFVNEQEWRLYNSVDTHQQTVTRIYQDDESTHPSFTAVCRASRRFQFYFWNIIFVMMFICSMSFTTFSVVVSKPENRLQLTFILLLTSITFKFAANQSLPKISYLTYLDKYILSSMTLMCAICVWHAIIPHVATSDPYALDKYILAVFGGGYLIAHIAFCAYIYVAAIRQRSAFRKMEHDHEIKRMLVAAIRCQQYRQQQQQQYRQEDKRPTMNHCCSIVEDQELDHQAPRPEDTRRRTNLCCTISEEQPCEPEATSNHCCSVRGKDSESALVTTKI